MGFGRSEGPLSENQKSEIKSKLLGPCQRTKKTVDHEGDGDSNCI